MPPLPMLFLLLTVTSGAGWAGNQTVTRRSRAELVPSHASVLLEKKKLCFQHALLLSQSPSSLGTDALIAAVSQLQTA